MRQFDEMLRRGLMEANLAQYETVLERLPEWEIDFSPAYRRERMRLLADPWGWVRRRERPVVRRGITRGIAVAIAILLLVTAAVAVAVPLWNAFFGGLDQRQQEIVGDMEIGGGEAEKAAPEETVPERLLPPPVEHDGVTITPLRILGARSQLYLVLEIRAPEGTVFHPEDDLQLFGGLRPSDQWRAEHPGEMAGGTSSFTVLEAGTTEPNVLVGVAEEMVSYDVGGATYKVRELYRRTEDGERETVFQAENYEDGTWDIPIPEDLNRDQVLEPQVEGMVMRKGERTMTLLSMSVSPLGIWWNYKLEGEEDPWPEARISLRMQDGSEIRTDPGQLIMGDFGSGHAAAVSFEKPVDLSQAEAVLWEDVVIPLEQPEQGVE